MLEEAAELAEAGEKGHVSAAQRWRQCAAYVGVYVSHPLVCDVAGTRRPNAAGRPGADDSARAA
jgi:hypothetical protein